MVVKRIHPESGIENKMRINITHNQLTMIENGGDLDGMGINQDELRFIQFGILPEENYEDHLELSDYD